MAGNLHEQENGQLSSLVALANRVLEVAHHGLHSIVSFGIIEKAQHRQVDMSTCQIRLLLGAHIFRVDPINHLMQTRKHVCTSLVSHIFKSQSKLPEHITIAPCPSVLLEDGIAERSIATPVPTAFERVPCIAAHH